MTDTIKRAPWADKNEVLAALMRSSFVGLLIKKRVSVSTAQEAFDAAVSVLGIEEATASDDERLKPLAKYLARERARGERRADRGVRHTGETVIYKAQRGSGRTKKRRPFVVVPLSTLEGSGGIDEVKVLFEKDRIIIMRKDSAP